MFDFQKEVIINATTSTEVRERVMVGEDKKGNTLFRVLRCADYNVSNILGGYTKTVGTPGEKASAIFTAPAVEGVYRVVVGISLMEKYMADYAMPWSKFSKPVIAEFEITADNKAKAGEVMAKALKLALPENYDVVKVSVSGNTVTVECTDTCQVIKEASISKMEASSCVDGCSEVEYVANSTAAVNANKMEVGTGQWLRENLRFPTSLNMGYYALHADEAPVLGVVYDQYSFEYASPRRGLGGQGTVGQMMTSVTTHTFYVPQGGPSDEFEKILKDAGIPVSGSTTTTTAPVGD